MRNCAHSILCCEEPTYRSITDVLYTIKAEIASIGEGILENMWHGTRYAEDSDDRIRKLNVSHILLDRLRAALRNQGSLCLSCNQVHMIIEGVRRTIGVRCDGNRVKGLEIDSSRMAEWSISNPFCISYPKWQKCMYEVGSLLGIKIVREDLEKGCSLSYDVIRKAIDCEVFAEIAKNSQNCVLKYNIFTDDKSCNAKYVGVLTKKECKASFEALMKGGKCNIGFHSYVNIINCGVGASLIGKIYSCGMSVKFSEAKRCPVLVTADGKEYYFTDFDVENESDIWNRLKVLHIA